MSRLFIGNLDGIGPAVKIMANDVDDPRTTPNTDWWKFRFNSETAEIGYVDEVRNASLFASDYPDTGGQFGVYPGGADQYAALMKYYNYSDGFSVLPNLANLFPGCEDFIHWIAADASDWNRLYAGVRHQYFSGGGDDYLYSFGRVTVRDRDPIFNLDVIARQGTVERSGGGGRYPGLIEWSKPSAGVVYNIFTTFHDSFTGVPDGTDKRADVTLYQTDLPIDDAPYPAVTGVPSAGLKIVRLDPVTAKIAKPGFDVDTASDDQLIVGHNKPPLLVARTGAFTLAPGAQQNVDVELPITPKSLVDFQVNQTGHDLYLPAYPDNDASELEIQYRIVGQQVQFKNPTATSFDVRFFVMAADELGTTAGGAKVLATTQGYIQMLRPGAATPPNSRDILLDSRATYLPMIAQGYVDAAAFASSGSYLGNLVYRVNLPAGDYKPFVLARSKNAFMSGGNQTGAYFYADFYGKQLSVYNYMADSTFLAHVTDAYVDFYANIRGVEDIWRYEISYARSEVYSQFLGMRYYIFAVPNSL